MDAWWFVSTDLAGNNFDLSCGEKKKMQLKKSLSVTSQWISMDLCWYMKEHCASENTSSGVWILASTEQGEEHSPSCMHSACMSASMRVCACVCVRAISSPHAANIKMVSISIINTTYISSYYTKIPLMLTLCISVESFNRMSLENAW